MQENSRAQQELFRWAKEVSRQEYNGDLQEFVHEVRKAGFPGVSR